MGKKKKGSPQFWFNLAQKLLFFTQLAIAEEK
jgi:hypothetical protein